jgi:hypothetical protein
MPLNAIFICLTDKGERSANKLRISQIRKYADINNLLDLRTFHKIDTVRIYDLRTQSCCDLRPQVRKYILFSLTNIAYHALIKIGT